MTRSESSRNDWNWLNKLDLTHRLVSAFVHRSVLDQEHFDDDVTANYVTTDAQLKIDSHVRTTTDPRHGLESFVSIVGQCPVASSCGRAASSLDDATTTRLASRR